LEKDKLLLLIKKLRKKKKDQRAAEQEKIIEMKNSYLEKLEAFVPTQVPNT